MDGFSEAEGLGVQIHFFDFCVGTHHGWRAPEINREDSIRDHAAALNVWFMERLRYFSENVASSPGKEQGYRSLLIGVGSFFQGLGRRVAIGR